ncbi:hypothetical protein GCM10007971_38490 [Oceanobacillus indicireducens]|uniref:Uncharacterized protein n=1 Tax=Oceanobacillus indicireducens TaxID=1004261 RepID=A0A918D5B7_9BACI|nr:hypothetical protein GCM10007971_38490 [Oceanobacillus indicireducens]
METYRHNNHLSNFIFTKVISKIIIITAIEIMASVFNTRKNPTNNVLKPKSANVYSELKTSGMGIN